MVHIENNLTAYLDSLSFKSELDSGHPAFNSSLNGLATELTAGNVTTARQIMKGLFEDFAAGLFPEAQVSWDGFIAQARDNAVKPASDPRTGASFDGFVSEFMAAVGITSLTDLGDWSALAGVTTDVTAFIKDTFVESFDHFIFNYTFTSTITLDDFLSDWRAFLTVTGRLDESMPAGQFANINSLRELFFAFNPTKTETDFESTLTSFYDEVHSKEGYFLPSQFFGDWFKKVQVLAAPISSVTGTESEKVLILNDIFRLLVDMIEVLQKIAATQASRLTFYTNFQKAYTELINKVPVITAHNVRDVEGSGSSNDAKRSDAKNDANALNQNYIENLRSFRSLVGDEAKQHQSSVNQSSETVNQQANLATAILQQMSTILQGLFR